MSKYKILFTTMNYLIPINGVAVSCNDTKQTKYWFKYKNKLDLSNIDYDNLEYIISELSDDNYHLIFDNHQNSCQKLGKQFYHSIEETQERDSITNHISY